jgi:hypothetical protein
VLTSCANALDDADKYKKVLVVVGRTLNNELNDNKKLMDFS